MIMRVINPVMIVPLLGTHLTPRANGYPEPEANERNARDQIYRMAKRCSNRDAGNPNHEGNEKCSDHVARPA